MKENEASESKWCFHIRRKLFGLPLTLFHIDFEEETTVYVRNKIKNKGPVNLEKINPLTGAAVFSLYAWSRSVLQDEEFKLRFAG